MQRSRLWQQRFDMKDFLPQGTILGDLTIGTTYDFHDRPVLFTCKNETGMLFLAVLADMSAKGDIWLYVPVSSIRFVLIKTGQIDLHDAFAKAEQAFLVITSSAAEAAPQIQQLDAGSVPEKYLPVTGSKLLHPIGTDTGIPPEVQAHQAWLTFTQHIDLQELQVSFERAVYDAILVERERCAQIAESFIPSGFRGPGKCGDHIGIARDDRARTIAAAIRRSE